MPAMRLSAASYEAADRQFTLSCKGCITGKVTVPTYQITLNTLHNFSLFRSSGYAGCYPPPPWCPDVRCYATTHDQQ